MSVIVVCPLSKVGDMVELHTPERVISLLNPDSSFPELGDRYAGRHLRLRFHDITLPAESLIAPEAEHIAELLQFLMTWDARATLLVHCHAGISRSTAVAYIAACQARPSASEHRIASALRRASPQARPNGRMIELADSALGRGGRMVAAFTVAYGALPWIEIDENEPFAMALS